MRSRVQATTREEKSDRWLDSGGGTRKHEAGKGTVREGRGQAVPQRWRKKQQGERKSSSRHKEKEQDRDQQRRMGSRTQMQKKTCNGQHDTEEGKKNGDRDLNRERWAKTENKKLQRQEKKL